MKCLLSITTARSYRLLHNLYCEISFHLPGPLYLALAVLPMDRPVCGILRGSCEYPLYNTIETNDRSYMIRSFFSPLVTQAHAPLLARSISITLKKKRTRLAQDVWYVRSCE